MTSINEIGESTTSRENIGNLLRIGVSIAASLVLAGGVLYLVRAPATEHAVFGQFHGESAQLRSLTSIFVLAFHGNARAIIQVGVLLLIATPVARVLFSAIVFVRAKDWIYVAISTLVFALLMFGIFFD